MATLTVPQYSTPCHCDTLEAPPTPWSTGKGTGTDHLA